MMVINTLSTDSYVHNFMSIISLYLLKIIPASINRSVIDTPGRS